MVETAEHIPCCAEMEQLRPAGSTVPGGEDVLLCGDLPFCGCTETQKCGWLLCE